VFSRKSHQPMKPSKKQYRVSANKMLSQLALLIQVK
jgi:hypothetical protein